MIELGVIGPDRADVGPEDGGVFSPRDVSEGLIEVPRDGRAVLALEMHVFAVGQPELALQGVVRVGALSQLAAANGKKLVGAVDASDLGHNVAGFAEGIVIDHEATGDGAGNFTASGRDAAEILGAIVVGNEIDKFAIR